MNAFILPRRDDPGHVRYDWICCPDIAEHAPNGIRSWRELMTAATLVRPWLGISPSAWEEANAVLGPEDAAVTVAAILQRSSSIKQSRRLSAQSDREGEGRGLFARACAHGFDQCENARVHPKTRLIKVASMSYSISRNGSRSPASAWVCVVNPLFLAGLIRRRMIGAKARRKVMWTRNG
jgi:hypothetical protein